MQAVIMAGGRGTRLRTVAADIPKPMVPILEKPILDYQLESLKRSGLKDIVIVIGHLGNTIRDYFGTGHKWNFQIKYIAEKEPLGTAGALYYLKESMKEDFLLIFGDLMLDVDWNRFMEFHKLSDSLITLFGHPNSHPFDSDLLLIDSADRVIGIDSKKNKRNYYYHNFVNAGLYCVSPELLKKITELKKLDLESDIIDPLISEGCVYAYKSTEYVKDMGTPERLYSVTADVKKGIVSNKNLRNKQKCIFLDRDGTINRLKGFLRSAEDFELLPGVAKAVKEINDSEYLVIGVTNQPVIARGECSFEELSRIHARMETELGKAGAYLDDIFYCPHHPDKGYVGEISELKIDCGCRKPKTGMIITAAEKYNIDLNASWIIGDSTLDIQTGINAGMHTMLIRTGEAGKDGKYAVCPEHIAGSLQDAVSHILGCTVTKS